VVYSLIRTLVIILVILNGASCSGAGESSPADPSSAASEGIITGTAELAVGGRTDFEQIRGRPVILLLFATSDSASELQFPEMKKVYSRLGGLVHFLALSVDKNDRALLDAYADFMQAGFPLGMAPDDIILGRSAIGTVSIIPTIVFIDRDGTVERVNPGALPASAIQKHAEKILGEIIPGSSDL